MSTRRELGTTASACPDSMVIDVDAASVGNEDDAVVELARASTAFETLDPSTVVLSGQPRPKR